MLLVSTRMIEIFHGFVVIIHKASEDSAFILRILVRDSIANDAIDKNSGSLSLTLVDWLHPGSYWIVLK